MGNLILKEEDKFNGRTFYKLNHKWELKKNNDLTEINMSIDFIDYREAAYDAINKIGEVVEEATGIEQKKLIIPEDGNYNFDEKHSCIRIIIELQSKNWWFLQHGSLIFLANGRKINLNAPVSRQSGTGTVKVNNKETHVVCNEHCVYLISKNDFKFICDAETVELQLSGDKWKQENRLSILNLDYFRLFYNQVFDSTLYTNVISKIGSYEKEMLKANVFGIGIGCVIPFILLMIVVFTYIYKEDGMGWTMGAPFIIAIGGGIIYAILSSKAKKKANQK